MGSGELAALIAAALWAFSSLLYTRIELTAWRLNFAKILIATLILGVQLALVAFWSPDLPVTGSPAAWGWLVFSGAVGLVIGDTCYFRCLQILGARRCLVITTTAPIFTMALGWIFLGEALLEMAILGVVLTVAGVAMVVSDRSTKEDEPGLYPGTLLGGVIFGLGAALCQAIGAVSSRHALKQCGALEATFTRMAAAAALCILIMTVRGHLIRVLRQLADRELVRRILPAVICGTWLGVWFSQIAFQKVTDAASAQTLLSTSPIFILGLAWLDSRTRPTRKVMWGVLIAVLGVFLIVR